MLFFSNFSMIQKILIEPFYSENLGLSNGISVQKIDNCLAKVYATKSRMVSRFPFNLSIIKDSVANHCLHQFCPNLAKWPSSSSAIDLLVAPASRPNSSRLIWPHIAIELLQRRLANLNSIQHNLDRRTIAIIEFGLAINWILFNFTKIHKHYPQ
jgi:hypothetical protein